jgi:predicted GNAT family acetyltransferase
MVWGIKNTENQLIAIAQSRKVTENSVLLYGVYTLNKLRRNGLAKQLLAIVFKDCLVKHNIKQVIIFTGKHNKPAQSVYEKLGFKSKGPFAILRWKRLVKTTGITCSLILGNT